MSSKYSRPIIFVIVFAIIILVAVMGYLFWQYALTSDSRTTWPANEAIPENASLRVDVSFDGADAVLNPAHKVNTVPMAYITCQSDHSSKDAKEVAAMIPWCGETALNLPSPIDSIGHSVLWFKADSRTDKTTLQPGKGPFPLFLAFEFDSTRFTGGEPTIIAPDHWQIRLRYVPGGLLEVY